MLGLEAYLKRCSLDVRLIHLVKLRASQIDGCAYCIDMHWKQPCMNSTHRARRLPQKPGAEDSQSAL